jgi:hypothetical protein
VYYTTEIDVTDDLPNREYMRRIYKHREMHRELWDKPSVAAIPPERYRRIYMEVAEILGRDYVLKILRSADRHISDVRIKDAMRALFAYPDCTYMFDLHPDAVKVLAACDNPAAALLYPVLVLLHEGD